MIRKLYGLLKHPYTTLYDITFWNTFNRFSEGLNGLRLVVDRRRRHGRQLDIGQVGSNECYCDPVAPNRTVVISRTEILYAAVLRSCWAVSRLN